MFSEKLKYEDIIHNQIEAYRLVRNTGDDTAIMYCVDGLEDLVTPNMVDPKFLEQMRDLEGEWEDEKKRKMKDYQRKIRAASGGCPDVIDRPALKPGPEYFARKFQIINALLERKDLGLKVKTVAYD